MESSISHPIPFAGRSVGDDGCAPVADGGREPMTAERAALTLPTDPAQISVARRFVRQTVTEVLPPDVVADLQLIASELVSNTIEHGGAAEVVVTLEWTDANASVLVTTDARATDLGPVDSWTIAQVDEVSGRGLGIVRELADSVAIEDAEAGPRVVATIDLTARS